MEGRLHDSAIRSKPTAPTIGGGTSALVLLTIGGSFRDLLEVAVEKSSVVSEKMPDRTRRPADTSP
jgi:hypothetical protein